MTANPHTVVSPYLRSQGISSRVACRNGGAVTNLWGLGTATAISDSESPIYIDDICEYVSFSASDENLACISPCLRVSPASSSSITLGKTVRPITGHVPLWFGSIEYFGMIMSPFGQFLLARIPGASISGDQGRLAFEKRARPRVLVKLINA